MNGPRAAYHCIGFRGVRKTRDERRMEKNWRVVMMVANTTAPYLHMDSQKQQFCLICILSVTMNLMVVWHTLFPVVTQ
jgi:hypothetical protein